MRLRPPLSHAAMINSWRAGWVLGLATVNMVGCGSDSSSEGGVSCGPGTVLSGDQCLPQCGPGTELQGVQCVPSGTAGNAGSGFSSAGKSGSGEAGETSGGQAGAAPDEEAGAPNMTGGGTGSAGQAGSQSNGGGGASGGKAGAAGTGGFGMGASGSAGVAGAAGHGPVSPSAGPLLTFSHSDGVFLYDAAQFPDSSGLTKLTTKAAGTGFGVGPFSPSGQWLAYVDGGDLYVRDVSGGQPGAPVLLLDEPGAFDITTASGRHCYWSADSKSLAFVSKGTAYVLPVNQSAPSVQRYGVSQPVPVLDWSPVGNRLALAQGNYTYVLEVDAGLVVKESLVANSAFKAWSPDGTSYAGTYSGLVTLTEVTGDVPVPHTLNTPTLLTPTITNVAYSATGATLAYMGAQERTGSSTSASYLPPDLYTISLKPSLATSVRATSALDSNTGATAFTFSPSGDRIAYLTQSVGPNPPSPSYRWNVLRVTGPQSGTSIPMASQTNYIPYNPTNSPLSSAWWAPNGTKFITSGNSSYPSDFQYIFDASGVIAPLKLNFFGASSNVEFAFAGQSSIFAGGGYDLYLQDVDNPSAGYGQVSLSSINLPWSWAPSGKFIVATSRAGYIQPSLTRVDGIKVSTPVAIYPTTSSAVINAWWQPSISN